MAVKVGPPVFYPPADLKREWYGDKYPGTVQPRIEKVLLHTTEGGSWPPYRDGAVAPNLTYNPVTRRWRQHFALNRSARALCDSPSTAVRENRDGVVQVEIICTCDPVLARKNKNLLYVEDITDDALADIGEFLAFMHEHYFVPLLAAPKWLPFPTSYGQTGVRLTGRQFDVWRGVLGHQHASGNVHGDPGRLDVPAIMRYATRARLGLSRQPVSAPVAAPARVTVPAAQAPAALPAALPGAARPALAPQEESMYRLLRTPDKRLWGAAGLQVTHLENPPIKDQYLKMAGLKDTDAIDVTYDLIAQFQRIT